MTEQEAPEADTDAAMDQTAAQLRSQMSETMAVLLPRLTTLANLASTGLISPAAEPCGAAAADARPPHPAAI